MNYLDYLKNIYEKYGQEEIDRMAKNYLAEAVIHDAQDFYDIPDDIEPWAVSGMLIDDYVGIADYTKELGRLGIVRKKTR